MEWIFNFIENYGVIAIIILIFLEYACFPVPSEVLLPIAGALSIKGNFFFVWILSIVAGIFGSIVCYLFGIWGRNYIDKSPRIQKRTAYALATYEKYQNISVLIGRVIPLCRTYISIVAGISKQKFINFITFSFVGIALWNFALMILGYVFYDNIEIVFKLYNQYKLLIILSGILIIILLIIKTIKQKMMKYKSK